MIKLVQPATFLMGATTILEEGLTDYLKHTGQLEFLESVEVARKIGLSDGEILCSFYAKLCYASLALGRNNNITKTRSILENLEATIESGHGSVFEHCYLNFVTTDCSRVFTHELVRHRVGTSFSQTSGRYVRTEDIRFVWDDILFDAQDEIIQCLSQIEQSYKRVQEIMAPKMVDFDQKKKITSAMRRILPNGQANEMGFGLNLRSLRHLIELRTSRHAEKEIRIVFNQVYELVRVKYSGILFDANLELVDGIFEITFKNKKI